MRRLLWIVLVATLATAALPAAAQTNIATVPVGSDPIGVGINVVTNTIYIANDCGADPTCTGQTTGSVTVIDGATNNVLANVNVGYLSGFAWPNPVTNKIYVANACGNDPTCMSPGTVSVIDGTTNQVTTTIPVGNLPYGEDVDILTNRIYVANIDDGTVSVIDGSNDTVIATVPVGAVPQGLSVDELTNKIYVGNYCGADPNCLNDGGAPGTVTVIDGATNMTTTVNVGFAPAVVLVDKVTNIIGVQNTCGNTQSCIGQSNDGTPGTVSLIDGSTLAVTNVTVGNGIAALAMNPVANKFYVSNNGDDTASIVDEATQSVTTVNVGSSPFDVEVDPDTNNIYVANNGDDTVTVIDGNTLGTTTVGVGSQPVQGGVNQFTNRFYVTNTGDSTVSVIGGAPADAVQFVALPPCRVVDTRNANGTFGGPAITGGTFRTFPLPQGSCGIPSTASGYSLNVTLVPPSQTQIGYLTIWPAGEIQPTVSTMNSLDGRVKANAAIVPAGGTGAVNVFASNTTDVVLDVNGYFTTPGSSTLEFFPLTPCRVIDTRNGTGPLAGPALVGGAAGRDFPVETSSCLSGVTAAAAYSFNVTVVPNPAGTQLGYLSVWPAGSSQPVVSTLNNLTATTVANAAIVPAGTGGDIDVFASNDTDLVVDINGYFAAPGAGGLSLYTTAPCRVLDTRNGNGAFNGSIVVPVTTSTCNPPSTAQAFVFNATVVPPGALGYLTLWADMTTQPTVSTLNALDGAITSNMAIVPSGTDGSIDAFSSNLTQLILDISSYFAPQPSH